MKWAKRLFARLFATRIRASRSRRSSPTSRPAQPMLETLETRIQPASLQLSRAYLTIVETFGPTATTSATVTRVNSDISQPLTVSLTSTNNAQVSFPSSVVIPVGQTSTTFNVTAVPDSTIDGTQNVTL